MNLLVSSEWEEVSAKHVSGHRIQIGGYSAAVEAKDGLFEYSVLQDHLRFVESGVRTTLRAAKNAAEVAIEFDNRNGEK